MEAKTRFHGCYVATLTPFSPFGSVDKGVIRAHAQWLIEQGIDGLCPAGTTGEFLYLSEQETQRVVAATVRGVGGRAPVIAGVWALRSEGIVANVQSAQECGADAVFLPPPIYYPASDQIIFRHYENARNASALPVFAYNIPQYAANEISFACLEKLFSEGIIVGVKDSTGNAERVGELTRRFGSEAVIFAAGDSFASEGRRLGADGFISAIANVCPSLFARLWKGEESLQPQMDALRASLKRLGAIPALKALMARRDFVFGASRLPFSNLTPAELDFLDSLELPS